MSDTDTLDLSPIDLDDLLPILFDYRARLMFHWETFHNFEEEDEEKLSKEVSHEILHDRNLWVAEGRDRLRKFLALHGVNDQTIPMGDLVRIQLFGLLLECASNPVTIGHCAEEDENGAVSYRRNKLTKQTIDMLSSSIEIIQHVISNSKSNESIFVGRLSAVFKATSPLEVDPVAPVVRVKKSGNEHTVTDKQWRILKLLNEIPGRVLSSSELGKMDAELEGTRCERVISGLPEEVRKHITSKSGKGSWIGVSSP